MGSWSQRVLGRRATATAAKNKEDAENVLRPVGKNAEAVDADDACRSLLPAKQNSTQLMLMVRV